MYRPQSRSYKKENGTLNRERYDYELARKLIYQQGGGLLPPYEEMKRRQKIRQKTRQKRNTKIPR